MRAPMLFVTTLISLGLTGCAGASLVAARAADDLHCPKGDIKVTSREMGAYDASGCGKRASYLVRGGEVEPDTASHDDLPDKMPKGEE